MNKPEHEAYIVYVFRDKENGASTVHNSIKFDLENHEHVGKLKEAMNHCYNYPWAFARSGIFAKVKRYKKKK